MKFSYDEARTICSLLNAFQDEQSSCIDLFQNNVIKIAEETNYKKLIAALSEMIEIYNTEICEKLHGRLCEQWGNGESLTKFSGDMCVGMESEEIASMIEATLNDLFIDKKNIVAEYKYTDAASMGEEFFGYVLEYLKKWEQDISGVSNKYIVLFRTEAEDNFLYCLLLSYVEAISTAFKVFVEKGKKCFENLEESFRDAMKRQLQKTTGRKEEKLEEDPFENLDIYAGGSAFGASALNAGSALENEPIDFGRLEEASMDEEPIDFGRLEEDSMDEEPIDFGRLEEDSMDEEPIDFGRLEEDSMDEEPIDFGRLEGDSMDEEPIDFGRLEEDSMDEEPIDFGRLEEDSMDEEPIDFGRLEEY